MRKKIFFLGWRIELNHSACATDTLELGIFGLYGFKNSIIFFASQKLSKKKQKKNVKKFSVSDWNLNLVIQRKGLKFICWAVKLVKKDDISFFKVLFKR